MYAYGYRYGYPNIAEFTDSYKVSHWLLYPPKMTEVSAYIESRQSGIFDDIHFFGLQYLIQRYLCNLEGLDLDEAERSWTLHGLPFNRAGWEYIKDLGYLPIEIQAVPEGSWIPKGNVLVQIKNTDPNCSWLPTWIETMLIQNVWYMSTVGTVSKQIRILLKRALELTGCEDIENVLNYMLHDFGFRATSGYEHAMHGGAAHLSTGFRGTDTAAALRLLRDFYGEPSAGESIPALEHSTVMTWEREYDAYDNALDKFLKPGKTVACVSDTTDLFKVVEEVWCGYQKDRIMNSGGRVVVRPDSGNATFISDKVITMLLDGYGYTTTRTGYKLLPNCIRTIWGDGINADKIEEVLWFMMGHEIAAENICFGMGSALLQEVWRDEGSFAMKVNEEILDGKRRPLSKNPKTGRGKASKAGRQALVRCDEFLMTMPESEMEHRPNLLRPVFRNGKLLIYENLKTIRNRANRCGFD